MNATREGDRSPSFLPHANDTTTDVDEVGSPTSSVQDFPIPDPPIVDDHAVGGFASHDFGASLVPQKRAHPPSSSPVSEPPVPGNDHREQDMPLPIPGAYPASQTSAEDTAVDVTPSPRTLVDGGSIFSVTEVERYSSPPVVPSAERLEFEQNIREYDAQHPNHILDEEEQELRERLARRVDNFEKALAMQRNPIIGVTSYRLEPPWSLEYIAQNSAYPHVLADYRALETCYHDNIRFRIDQMRGIVNPDQPEYPSVADELTRVLEWGEVRDLLTPLQKREKSALKKALNDLDTRVTDAIATYQAVGVLPTEEQNISPITDDLPDELYQFTFRWPDIRRRWETLRGQERETFPSRFPGRFPMRNGVVAQLLGTAKTYPYRDSTPEEMRSDAGLGSSTSGLQYHSSSSSSSADIKLPYQKFPLGHDGTSERVDDARSAALPVTQPEVDVMQPPVELGRELGPHAVVGGGEIGTEEFVDRAGDVHMEGGVDTSGNVEGSRDVHMADHVDSDEAIFKMDDVDSPAGVDKERLDSKVDGELKD